MMVYKAKMLFASSNLIEIGFVAHLDRVWCSR